VVFFGECAVLSLLLSSLQANAASSSPCMFDSGQHVGRRFVLRMVNTLSMRAAGIKGLLQSQQQQQEEL
jgi:hypothetical protein